MPKPKPTISAAKPTKPTAKPTKRRRPSLLARLVAPFKRLLGRSKAKAGAKAGARGGAKVSGKAAARATLLPGGDQKRTLAQWKELRRRTTAEVKAHLAEQQPVPAIKKLTLALLPLAIDKMSCHAENSNSCLRL